MKPTRRELGIQAANLLAASALMRAAEPVEHVSDDTCFALTMHVYGDHPIPFTLYADDGRTLDYAAGRQNQIHLSWQNGEGRLTTEGDYKGPDRYKITAWQRR